MAVRVILAAPTVSRIRINMEQDSDRLAHVDAKTVDRANEKVPESRPRAASSQYCMTRSQPRRKPAPEHVMGLSLRPRQRLSGGLLLTKSESAVLRGTTTAGPRYQAELSRVVDCPVG